MGSSYVGYQRLLWGDTWRNRLKFFVCFPRGNCVRSVPENVQAQGLPEAAPEDPRPGKGHVPLSPRGLRQDLHDRVQPAEPHPRLPRGVAPLPVRAGRLRQDVRNARESPRPPPRRGVPTGPRGAQGLPLPSAAGPEPMSAPARQPGAACAGTSSTSAPRNLPEVQVPAPHSAPTESDPGGWGWQGLTSHPRGARVARGTTGSVLLRAPPLGASV